MSIDFTDNFIATSKEDFLKGEIRSVNERKSLLIKFKKLLKENRQDIFVALYEDLRKSEAEATISEFVPLMDSFNFMIKNIKKLAKPKRVSAGLANFPGSGRIYSDPYGTVLVISTWNYPLLLSIDPLIGAIAAGNNVVLKMSPNTPATSRVLANIIKDCFGSKCCITDESYSLENILNKHKFDYIFFTGGAETGHLIAKAAAKNLTPVTLELGGKSPCLVDETSDLKLAAKRIVWGKFMNAGQTCVAPDYLLIDSKVIDKFLPLLNSKIREYFGDNPELSEHYVRIVNESNFTRLCGLLEEGKLVSGGDKNPETLYIAPTILKDIKLDSKIMEREIFGPILPVIIIDSFDEGLQIIREREKPLAAYYFSKKSSRIKEFLTSTSSGGVSINDTVMHLSSANLPFGGVGASGMGAYHGKASFLTFSHSKSVLLKNKYLDMPLRYLPYSKWKITILKFLQKYI